MIFLCYVYSNVVHPCDRETILSFLFRCGLYQVLKGFRSSSCFGGNEHENPAWSPKTSQGKNPPFTSQDKNPSSHPKSLKVWTHLVTLNLSREEFIQSYKIPQGKNPSGHPKSLKVRVHPVTLNLSKVRVHPVTQNLSRYESTQSPKNLSGKNPPGYPKPLKVRNHLILGELELLALMKTLFCLTLYLSKVISLSRSVLI